MASLFQILKKKPTDSVNFLVVNVCHLITLNNGSKCPSQVILYTNKRLSSVVFDDQDVIKIIRALNINKVDDISIRMIKICDSALKKHLSIIFNNSLKTCTFPYIWKQSYVIPVHKK